jgi:hypothetical protein
MTLLIMSSLIMTLLIMTLILMAILITPNADAKYFFTFNDLTDDSK